MVGPVKQTYYRKRRRDDPWAKQRDEAIRKRQALKAVGATSWAQLGAMMRLPARDVIRRPSLQVATFYWNQNRTPLTIPSETGYVAHFSSYPFGSADSQRHTNETLTYKASLSMQICLGNSDMGKVGKWPVYFWLIYDKAPTGVLPACSTIFDVHYNTRPVTWHVTRDQIHRFVVKRKFKVVLSNNGIRNGRENGQHNAYPCNDVVDTNRFFNKLGVRTEWKNQQTGDIADIKSGALYLCVATTGGISCNIYSKFRMYFKSVGNQ